MKVLTFLLVLGVLSGCQARDATPKVAEKPATERCRVAGIDIAIDCGVIEVFENRAANVGRRIEIHFAVLRAKSDRKKSDPLFILAGGPGQSAIQVAPMLQGMVSKINRERDIVFVDQRGTGESNALKCDPEEDEDNFNFADATRAASMARNCLAEVRTHADPVFYTTPLAMQDLEDVRKVLGYAQINLWGASYGTRAALEYLRRHPGAVRSVVLDGVAPFDIRLPLSFIADGNAALASLIAACDAAAECKKTFPHFAADVRRLLADLRAKPRTLEVVHPRTGEKIKATITPAALLGGMRAALYGANFAGLIPHAIEAALTRDFAPIVTLAFSIGGPVLDQLAIGMHLSVVCAEDWPLVEAKMASLINSRQEFYGAETIEEHQRMCAIWPRGQVPKDYYDAVKSGVPVLLLSGGIDPATPPHHAEQVLNGLSRGKHLVAPNIGHGVSLQGCAPEIIRRFIEDGNADKVDGACLAKIPRPPFYLPLTTAQAAK
jgi:pimeloyl-ACP methyl ester carboxylesterase